MIEQVSPTLRRTGETARHLSLKALAAAWAAKEGMRLVASEVSFPHRRFIVDVAACAPSRKTPSRQPVAHISSLLKVAAVFECKQAMHWRIRGKSILILSAFLLQRLKTSSVTMRVHQALDRGAYQSTRAEECRLFYTALTRAERYLYVSGSEQLPGGARARKRSDFALRLNNPELIADPLLLPADLTQSTPRARIDESVLPTSFTDIRYFLNCPRNYRFRKGFGFSPPIPEMFGFGMTVHTAVGKLHEEFAATTPSIAQAEEIARRVFHLKHMPPSGDPENRPGGFERAKDSAARILGNYANDFGGDFTHTKQVEVRFEIPAQQAVITGAIDLLLRVGPADEIVDASVIDFKAMKGSTDPAAEDYLHWTELALQVQLYAKAAREVLGENARTGAVHLLKSNQRVEIPVNDSDVAAAVSNVEWAVNRILDADYPMRPHPEKCEACDFKLLCLKSPEQFNTDTLPPPISIPGITVQPESQMARAFSEFQQ